MDPVLDLTRNRRQEDGFASELVGIPCLELRDANLDVLVRNPNFDQAKVVTRLGGIDERQKVHVPRANRLGSVQHIHRVNGIEVVILLHYGYLSVVSHGQG